MSDSLNQHIGYVDTATLTVSLCLTYTICIGCVRIWIRRGAYGLDDLVVLLATVITLGHTGSSYAALANGLGKPWSSLREEENLDQVNAASVAGVVTFIFALYTSKIGVLTFLSRITKNKSQLLGYYACCALVAIFGIMSILVVTVQCPSRSGYYWAFHANSATCPSQVRYASEPRLSSELTDKSVRWQVITGLDIITELGLLVLPVQLVGGLQMPRLKKAILLVAFYVRLPVIGLSLGRNYYTLQLRLPKSDAGLDSALVVIWIEVQLAYALASSTLSALKAFTESFNSGFGLGFTRGKSDSNYALSGMSGKSGCSSKTEKAKSDLVLDSNVASSGVRSPELQALKYEDIGVDVKPLSSRTNSPTDEPLRLRPEERIKSFASVHARPAPPEPVWRQASCTASESSDGDMVILRETELSVQQDRAPMLRCQSACA